jgi:hypothetical protein
MADTATALDELYSVPPEEFTRRRAELIAASKAAGRHEETEALHEARKPNSTSWALNQAVRRHPQEIERLFAAGNELQRAQAATLAGQGAEPLRKAQEVVSAIAIELLDEARAMLKEHGHPATPEQSRRMAQTLRAAALGNDDVRLPFREGRLVTDLVPVATFGAGELPAEVHVIPPPPRPPPASAPPKAASYSETLRRAEEAKKRAREVTERARREVAQDKELLEKEEVERHERENEQPPSPEELRRSFAEASRRADVAEKRAQALRQTAEMAEKAAAHATERAKAARERANEAQVEAVRARERAKKLRR